MGLLGNRAVAIVGVGAVMPDAPDAAAFWQNICDGRYSITETPPDRWDPALYYDPDPQAVDTTYSKIGGWVRDFTWEPLRWRLPIPPTVDQQIDGGQKWALACSRAALLDAGWPDRPLDGERTAVVIGNAMAGEKHYESAMRIQFPEFARELELTPSFAGLSDGQRATIVDEVRDRMRALTSDITEDTMPGELGNILAGRVANLLDLRGPNYVVDAACASALAAMEAAVEGLIDHEYDAVLTGGVDRNMGIAAFVKFCKIGALSATGTRPYGKGADGFVMGEGAAMFLLKRLADAERDGDRIYAVVCGLGGASDGKGKGITAPNPAGQRLAVERAWATAGLDPTTAGYVEGHGTSTAVGDVVEVQALTDAFGAQSLPAGSIPLGSVKSNIGHLKAAAGAAGLFKTILSLHHKTLPPSINAETLNPNLDWSSSPFRVNHELTEWVPGDDGVRRAGVSAFGFGGTNFHAVLEEYVPGRWKEADRSQHAVGGLPERAAVPAATATSPTAPTTGTRQAGKAPLRGLTVLGAQDMTDLGRQVTALAARAAAGEAPRAAEPDRALRSAPVRLAVDFADAADLTAKLDKVTRGLGSDAPAVWRMLRQQGIHLGRGTTAPPTAFLYTGQGSQYVNMCKDLAAIEPIVADTFAEADRIMTPLLGRPLTDYIFIDADDAAAVAQLEQQLLQTEITQPAVLATDLALTRLLAAYGIEPDMVMGHSLGEYGALVAAGSLSFGAALEAVSARGQEMAGLTVEDNGAMAAVFAPLAEIEEVVDSTDGYVVIANVNSTTQAVIGGATAAVAAAIARFQQAGHTAVRLPVSHAFHTSIVAPASEPLKASLARLDLRAPTLPIVANVDGGFYPTDGDVRATMLDILGRQVASPVQFVAGLHTLFDAGARVFVEVGPKRALHGFVEDVLGAEHDDVLSLYTNHPKGGGIATFNQALAGLYAAGHGLDDHTTVAPTTPVEVATPAPTSSTTGGTDMAAQDQYTELGRLFAEFLDRGRAIREGNAPAAAAGMQGAASAPRVDEPVVITGAGLGLPGTERVFADDNIARLLNGEQFIDQIPSRMREEILAKRITRLVKREDGNHSFETIDHQADVIKLAGRRAAFDLASEFGIDPKRVEAFDKSTELAIASGLEALRDAGIPLVQHYKTTSVGSQLPDRWLLPEDMRDDTGVIFASAFPGMDRFVDELERYYRDLARRDELVELRRIRGRMDGGAAADETDRRIRELEVAIEQHPYTFDRRFLFRVIAFGHAQFAELIGARGPNTQVNGACASTTQAIGIAEDWIRSGRCRRVVVISADDVTNDAVLPWAGSGFLATGAAATDDVVAEAALPFDNRRHGMLLGMGAASVVIEAAGAVRERGIRPIAEVLSTVIANSAFHGTRLDVDHIRLVADRLLRQAEAHGVRREQIADRTVFVSHETYTPARGGSASAEVNALRHVFGDRADDVVIANTKGYTGHAMGAGVEDVLAVRALETGIVPPIPNHKEIDPELGPLNLSRGGHYDVEYAMRLGAGFGSQIAMTLTRWVPSPTGARTAPDQLGYASRIADQGAWEAWLRRASGQQAPVLEVIDRQLRIIDTGSPARVAPAATEPAASVAAAPQPTPAPAPAPAALTPAEPAVDPVQTAVVALVAEMTGYPEDLLDLDLDLEADLGVDTVKQAEVFAALRERYDIARDESLQLRDFPTLSHVIGFVRDRADVPPTPTPEAAPTAPAPAEPAVDPVQTAVVALVAEMTGYPEDLLDLDLDLEADLGVDTVKQAEVFAALRERYDIARDESLQLRDFPTLSHVIGFVRDRADVPPTPTPMAAPATPAPAEPAVDPVQTAVVALVAEMTGYPEDLLDLDLDLEADLGVDTVKQAEVFAALRERYDIARDESLQLRDFPTLSHVIGFVRDRADVPPTPTPEAAPAPAPATAPGVAAPAATEDPVVAAVVGTVAEMTGYPEDLLDLDLDLEADLGVDTVKQAEVFATLREQYGIERDDDLQLRDFPTLNHVIGFVRDRAGIPEAAPATLAAAGTQAPAESAAAADDTDEVVAAVVGTVAEMTGYPEDLLDLDLDLEADLGVDTVKQAEVFATLREQYGIERDDDLQLRDFPTLNHVIGFVRDRADLGAPSVDAPVTAESSPAAAASDDRMPRRVPVPVLRPSLDDCVPTGIELGGDSRVVVMPDTGGVADALVGRLEDRDAAVLVLDPSADADGTRDALNAFTADGAVTGVYWLPALDEEDEFTELDHVTWREALRQRVKLLHTTMQHLYDQVDDVGTFLVSATRLGGFHGYDEDGATGPLGGAVSGFTKAYKRERPDVLVKCVDVPPSRKTASLADVLMAETERDPGCVEVGRGDDRRWTVGLRTVPFTAEDEGLELTADTTFVVTGAAGSITSAITADLAAASGGTFHLLDLTPSPDPDDTDLQAFTTDPDGLKATIADRLREAGERPTPVMIERELAQLERLAAAWAAIGAVEEAGGTAHYHSVDLTDHDAVAAVLDTIRETTDKVDVLVHAAGLEISHALPDKPAEQFALVFDVKCDGWFNVLHAAGDLPIGATVCFSSIAGRFGNAGQTDYSAANDLLCKTTSSFRRTRPDTRAVALDWTAWGGIGMATRGSIPKVMEMAGIDMLPPEIGIPWVRRELIGGSGSGEVVVAGDLGILAEQWHPTGGVDPAALDVTDAGPMVGGVVGATATSIVVETELDPARHGFLDDHRIDGTPVLPGVMGMEAFAEAAALLAPDLHVVAVEDMTFDAPFKCYRDEPRTVRVVATLRREGTEIVADCELVGERILATQEEPVTTTHFTGRVRLAEEPTSAAGRGPAGAPHGDVVTADDLYRVYFHGPAYQVLDAAWGSDQDGCVGRFAADVPPNQDPADAPLRIAPRLAELCFQTAGVWEIGTTGRMALPAGVERLAVHGSPAEADDLHAVATPRADGSIDVVVLDGDGGVLVEMAGYRTIELPAPVDEELRAPFAAAMDG